MYGTTSWSVCLLTFAALIHGQDPMEYRDGLYKPFIPSIDTKTPDRHIEYEGYDGWYNNRAHPEWGRVDQPLLRRLPSAYEDGVYEPSGKNRPNPFNISSAVMAGETGNPSHMGRTALLVFFGQQVVEEILDAQGSGCPPEYHNIEIPKGHDFDPDGKGGKFMPFLRSRYDFNTGYSPNNPRQQLNEITPYIDGGLMYGIGKAWADALRALEGGRLAAVNDSGNGGEHVPKRNDIRLPMANPPPPRNHHLKNVDRFYVLGNPRGNENPFLLTFGILWFRWHNVMARRIEAQSIANNWNWSDEKIYNEARKWTIATHQNIVSYQWLPSWLGEDNGTRAELPAYDKYNPNVHPGIAHVFQSAAMRFGHTLVPPGVYRRNAQCDFRMTSKKTGAEGKLGLRTCNTFWNPQESIDESGIEEFLMGMASQITEREDHIITPDLRGNVFGPLEFSRRDLMAINIQRGRDHGLPDYNTAREEYDLPRVEQWEAINEEICPTIDHLNCYAVRQLRDVYENHVRDNELAGKNANDSKVTEMALSILDIWPAGIVETRSTGPGPLFQAIIKDQFTRIRDGDRFWFENRLNGLFTEEEIEDIKKIRLIDVILATTNITSKDIQEDPFFWHSADWKRSNSANCTSTNGTNCTLMFYDDPCPQPAQLNHSNPEHFENCSALLHYDYFSGSDVPYALTFLAVGVFAVGCVGLLIFLSKKRERDIERQRKLHRAASRKKSDKKDITTAVEFVGKKEGTRTVKVKLNESRKTISIVSERNRPLRAIDLSLVQKIDFHVSADRGMKMMIVRVPKEYDLILRFDRMSYRGEFIDKLEKFLDNIGVGREVVVQRESELLKHGVTKEKRQMLLEKFFRAVFSRAFGDLEADEDDLNSIKSKEAKEIVECELTKTEFAEALGAKLDSVFVENMFQFIDKDSNGYISFREFLDMMIIFAKGSADDKAKLMFDMYDIDQTGAISRVEFEKMLRSFMDMSNTTVEESELKELVDTMFTQAGLSDKSSVRFKDFMKMIGDYKDALGSAQLNFAAAGADIPDQQAKGGLDHSAGTLIKRNTIHRARSTIVKALRSEKDEAAVKRLKRFSSEVDKVETIKKQYPRNAVSQKLHEFTRYVENYRLHIFWVTLYTLVTIGIFVERAYYYSVEREHSGLRRIAGYGVTVTRGAASGMMFTYSCLLVTMCRNLITFLRETFLHRFVPFDAAIEFHKYIAGWALFMTLMHIVGHAINFYHISTQTPGDLTCLFRDFFRPTHVLPTFTYWCWNTITGFTGVLLTLIIILMYTFAIQFARRHVFTAFWITHNLYYVLFVLMFFHGSGNLVQPPFMHFFGLAPIILFALDKLVSYSRNRVEISVISAELLPSDVTQLVFKRPLNFEYKSGQWVRIACLAQGKNEYHPFTISSAPHEDTLSLHIRAVGPWTTNLRHTYDPSVIRDHPYPKLYLDGPFGEGHQDWYKYDVSVLVGGGIGVTPFASILKDLVNRSTSGAKIVCKKVYFLWVTRTQKHYEWLTDIIREVEEKDVNDLVSVHIFITQFQQKFDMRTTMLYICERHFQKISNRSLFTGLRSITHFGRPNFESFLNSLQHQHYGVNKIGVFSCGPPPMTNTVDKACATLNKFDGATFAHHFENF